MCMDETPFGTADAYIVYLMQQYSSLVYSCALSLTKEAIEADEVTQEVYLQTYSYLVNHPHARIDDPVAWFRVTTKRVYYNHCRKYRREQSLEELSEQETGPLQLVTTETLPDIVAASNEGVSNIRTCIDALPDMNIQEPTSMFYLDEYSYAEIAESLGRPLGTVKNQIYRGRKALQEGLRTWIDGGSA